MEEDNESDNFELSELDKLQFTKEAEIKKIHLMKIKHLEKLIEEKNKKVETVEEKFKSLKEDFDFNIQLIEERDNDLALYENKIEKFVEILNEKDKIILEITKKNEELNFSLNNHKGKKETTEEMYKYKLNQLNSSHKEEIKSLNNTISDLNNSIKKLQNDYNNKSNDLKINTENQNKLLESINQKQKEDINNLMSKFKTQEIKIADLTESLNESNTKANKLRDENISLLKSVDILENKLKNYENLENEGIGLTQILNEKIKHLRSENTELRNLQTKIDNLNKTNEDLTEKTHTLTTHAFKKDMEIEKKNHTIESLNEKIKELNDKINEVKENSKQFYTEKLEDVKQKNRELTSENKDITRQLKELESHIKRNEDELRENINLLKQTVSEKDRELLKEKDKNSELETKVKKIVQSIEINKLKDKPLESESNANLNNEMRDFFNKGYDQNLTFEGNKKTSNEKDGITNMRLKEKDIEITQLKNENNNLKNMIDDTHRKLEFLNQLQIELEDEKEENRLLHDKIKNINENRQELLKLKEESAKFDIDRTSLIKTAEKLRKENIKLKDEKDKLQKMYSKLRADMNRLQNQYKELEAGYTNTNINSNNNNEDIDYKQNNINEYNEHNNNEHNELDWLNNSSNIANVAPTRDLNNYNSISFNDGGFNQNVNNIRVADEIDIPSPKVLKKDNNDINFQVEKLKQKKNDLFQYKEDKDDLKNLLTIKRVDVSPGSKPLNGGSTTKKTENNTKEQIIHNLHSIKDRERAENSDRSPDNIINPKDNLKSKLIKRSSKGNNKVISEN